MGKTNIIISILIHITQTNKLAKGKSDRVSFTHANLPIFVTLM